MRAVAIWNETRKNLVGSYIQIADTSLRRAKGLLGRRKLHADEGLWIRPSSGIHTFGMAFAIDVVGIGRDLTVVRIWSSLPPNRMTGLNWQVRSVIELPAGKIVATGLRVGDLLAIQNEVEAKDEPNAKNFR